MNLSIALEGLPGSGKTSLKNDLNFAPWTCDRVEQILPGDPDDDTDLTFRDIFQSDLLKSKRSQEANTDIVIYDRYYLSTLAYQYAHDKRFGTDYFASADAQYQAAIDDGRLRIPDITFYIITPLALSYERKERLRNQDIWTDEMFLAYTKEFYDAQEGLVAINGSMSYNDVKNTIETIVAERLRTSER